MTIGIGMLCNDGIVMGADTLIEGEGKIRARKLWGHISTQDPDTTFAVVGAGYDDEIRMLHGLLLRAPVGPLADTPAVSRYAQVLEALEDATVDFYPEHVWNQPDVKPSEAPEFLIAVRSGQRGGLHTLRNGSFAAVPSDRKFAVIGSGGPLAHYLASTLFKPEMGRRAAAVLAAYIIRQAKRFAPGVGGDTHLAIIPWSGKPFSVSAEDVSLDEDYFAGFLDAAVDLAHVGLNGYIGTGSMNAKIDALKVQASKLRDSVLRGQPLPDDSEPPDDDWAEYDPDEQTTEPAQSDPQPPTPDPSHQPPSPESDGGSRES